MKTIIIGGVCAAWLVYEYRTAPIIESLDGMTGNECQCHGLQGSNSNHDGELRRAKEGNDGMGLYGSGIRTLGGLTTDRVGGVDCVAGYRGKVLCLALASGDQRWMFTAERGIQLRSCVTSLAFSKQITLKEAAGINVIIFELEGKVCKTS